jgi:MFS family permease
MTTTNAERSQGGTTGEGPGLQGPPSTRRRALSPGWALALLLGLNLLNYADRSVLSALESKIELDVLAPGDTRAAFKMGSLMFAFLVTYMLLAPAFGILADRWKRWWIVGLGVIGGGLASFGTGLTPMLAAAGTGVVSAFSIIFVMRMLVGVSESAYGPAAPTLISDLFAVANRGKALAVFYLAIPVGSALGYVYGGLVGQWLGWQWAFYLLLPPALLMGVVCFFLAEPRRGGSDRAALGGGELGGEAVARKLSWSELRAMLRVRSFAWNCAGQTAMTFAIGGIAFFMPRFVYARTVPAGAALDAERLGEINITFGGVTVVCGIVATLAGGWLADRLRARFQGAYLLSSGVAMLLAFPAFVGVLRAPFPLAWVFVALTVLLVFLNTGPSNAAIANVVPAHVRSSAFAFNIFIIHALGDAISPALIGLVRDWRVGLGESDGAGLAWGFGLVAGALVLSGVFFLIGSRTLGADTLAASGGGPGRGAGGAGA